MKLQIRKLWNIKGQNGGVMVMVTILLVLVLIGIAAYAIDVSHLSAVHRELQSAADAGALAGARALLDDHTGAIETDAGETANEVGNTAAGANQAEKNPVEVHYVHRGHWDPTTRTFTANDGIVVNPDLWGVSTDDLYANTNFINAVEVETRRSAIPADSILAGIFGHDSFSLSARAVAWRGFAGQIEPHEVDQPIAICKSAITTQVDGEDVFSCNIGRMINSGQNPDGHNTAGWSNFYQSDVHDDGKCNNSDDSCNGAANANEVKDLVNCNNPDGGNPQVVCLGQSLQANGGNIASAFNALRDCWWPPQQPQPTTPWHMTLPVIDCDDRNIGSCPKVEGAVSVDLIWMSTTGNPGAGDEPGDNGEDMTADRMNNGAYGEFTWNYEAADQCVAFKNQVTSPAKRLNQALPNLPDGFQNPARWQGQPRYVAWMAKWDCFVQTFNLRDVNGAYAPLQASSMYFLPSCEVHEPTGKTGGENFGIWAKYPALVN